MAKLKVEKKVAQGIVKEMKKVILTKTKVPILTGLYVSHDDNEVTFRAANTDGFCLNKVLSKGEGVDLEGSGAYVVNFKVLETMLKKLKGDIVFEIGGDIPKEQVRIADKKVSYTIETMGAEHFPKLPNLKKKEIAFTGKTSDFVHVVGTVVGSVGVLESRPILTGLNFTNKDGKLVVVATDAHRLTRNTMPVETEKEFNVTIPGKALKALTTFSLSSDEMVVRLDDPNTIFSFGDGTTVIIKALDGNYPDVDRLIPKSFTTEIDLNPAEAIEKVEAVQVISSTSRNNIIKLETDGTQAEVSSAGQGIGKANAKLDVEDVSGGPLTISFNPSYMKDALTVYKAKKTPKITVKFISAVRPFLIEEEGSDLLQLITPVRTA